MVRIRDEIRISRLVASLVVLAAFGVGLVRQDSLTLINASLLVALWLFVAMSSVRRLSAAARAAVTGLVLLGIGALSLLEGTATALELATLPVGAVLLAYAAILWPKSDTSTDISADGHDQSTSVTERLSLVLVLPRVAATLDKNPRPATVFAEKIGTSERQARAALKILEKNRYANTTENGEKFYKK